MRNLRSLCAWAALLALIAGAPRLYAETPIAAQTIRSPDTVYTLGSRAYILEDPQGRLSLDEVRKTPEKFRISGAPIPNFGFTNSVYWFRIVLKNESPLEDWLLRVSYPPLDSIQLFHFSADGARSEKTAGDLLPFHQREIKNRNFLMRLSLPPGTTSVLYLRFKTEGSSQFPLELMSQASLNRIDHEEQLALGLYYGILLVLIFYNLILLFIVRDLTHLYYLLYVTGYGLIQMILNGLAYEYLWPNSPWWANVSLPFLIGWSFLWILQFSRSLLLTRKFIPVWDKILFGIMICMGTLSLASFFLTYNLAIIAAAVLVSVFSLAMFIAAIQVVRKRYRPARYFLIAWAALLTGALAYALKGLGVLPANFLTEYGLQIGSALEMSLLSMGLADRLNVLRQEKEEARRMELESRRIKQESQLRAARLEIELLKKNIQPHFLMNSINATIMWLSEDPKSAELLLSSLADELRMLQEYSGKSSITLEEEVRLCEAHLQVMSLRHDKKFRLRVKNLDPKEKIPPLIFHTLVENGLTHGFAEREEGVFILARDKRDQSFRYVLSNDGNNTSGSRKSGSGLGLKYIRTRLQEFYPNRWTLKMGPHARGWATIIEITENSKGAPP